MRTSDIVKAIHNAAAFGYSRMIIWKQNFIITSKRAFPLEDYWDIDLEVLLASLQHWDYQKQNMFAYDESQRYP